MNVVINFLQFYFQSIEYLFSGFPVYSNAIQENMNSLLYPGLIEELVDIVELKDNTFVVSFHSFYMISVRFELYVSNRC